MCFKVLVHIPILLSLPSPPFNRHLSLLTFSEGYAQHCRRRASAVSRLPPFVFVSNFMMLPPGAETCRSTLNMRVLSHPAREAAAPLLTPAQPSLCPRSSPARKPRQHSTLAPATPRRTAPTRARGRAAGAGRGRLPRGARGQHRDARQPRRGRRQRRPVVRVLRAGRRAPRADPAVF